MGDYILCIWRLCWQSGSLVWCVGMSLDVILFRVLEGRTGPGCRPTARCLLPGLEAASRRADGYCPVLLQALTGSPS